jgi:hypothetical protein
VLIADNTRTGPIRILIQAARRRRTCMLALEALGLAFAIVLAGFILMLVLGTQVLRWYWLSVLGAGGLGLVGYRVYIQRLSSYRLAQLLDRRLRLTDSLSTAWFLLTDGRLRQYAAARFQIAKAEEIAARVDLSRVFCFRGRRSWALAGAFAAVALGLFALRYLITNSLSLQHAMVPLQIGEVLERIENRIALPSQRKPQFEAARRRGVSPPAAPQEYKQLDEMTARQNLATSRTNDRNGQDEGKRADAQNAADPRRPPTAGTAGQKENSATQQARQGVQSEEVAPRDKSSQSPAASKENPGSSNQDRQGLMDKMKDALSSLMAKVHPNASGQDSRPDNQRPSPDKSSADQTSAAQDQNGNAQQSARDQEYQRQNTEGTAQGQTTEKTRASEGRDSGESPDKKSASAHSGIGHTNGDKDIKDAEQLKAMGKLAEIIGKRSASLTGDMTVETSSTNQQLKTQYSGRVGHHADLGGEINRDEIPAIYRDYVREYMQLVHKQAEKQQ